MATKQIMWLLLLFTFFVLIGCKSSDESNTHYDPKLTELKQKFQYKQMGNDYSVVIPGSRYYSGPYGSITMTCSNGTSSASLLVLDTYFKPELNERVVARFKLSNYEFKGTIKPSIVSSNLSMTQLMKSLIAESLERTWMSGQVRRAPFSGYTNFYDIELDIEGLADLVDAVSINSCYW